MLHNTRAWAATTSQTKITRPEKRKRVTVIAGFQCLDALLMCADSEPDSPVRAIRALRGFV